MNISQMRHNYAVSVGEPPPLRGPGALVGFGSSQALFGYIRATMPRPFPGTLPDDELWAIVAFLLEANGIDTGSGPVGPDQTIVVQRSD